MTAGKWRRTTLGDFVRLQRGHDLPADARRPGTIPVFGSAGPNGCHDTALAKGPGVAIGRSGVGSAGVVSFSPTDFWPHNTVLYVTDFLGNNERFAYYLLRTLDLRRFDSGSAQASINRNFLYPIPIEVPGREEQDRIATLLGALDDKIALHAKMNATLEAMARAVFEDWFIRFGPVRTKAEGRAPPGLAPDLAALFPDRLTETADGEVPGGWRCSTVGEEVECVGGSTPSTDAAHLWHPGEHAWTTPKDLAQRPEPFLLTTSRKISAAGLAGISSGLLPVGSVLLSSRAPIGYRAITAIPVAINQGYIGLRCTSAIGPEFVYLWLGANMDGIHARANGSTFMEISKASFRPIPMLVPPQGIMEGFVSLVRPMFDRIRTNQEETRTLTELRDLLLPRLISGQLRLRGAEHALEAVL
ncbi:restriction endonuclease subunit S [Roseococcus sp. SDR]|uniref:restriction endonuclease subunit S n=1 Tax=Roseococcus sp. SDR TaxID=2835532 RepID=UPI001BCFD420|nr:restriction endonuclease subunit S [Roseococcus sp. SDR]MBS7790092.1 restriction endonuclease subunit S [Roseococcus sp. SDR]MBV1845406.1 restriction endonuclease subunit S [Roseococcus sp. SDR]